MLHAEQVVRAGTPVIVEFGSWSRAEREVIRQLAVRTGVPAEFHFVDAPIEELIRRVRERGGPAADVLADKVLRDEASRLFQRPIEDEVRGFDRYVGPGESWVP